MAKAAETTPMEPHFSDQIIKSEVLFPQLQDLQKSSTHSSTAKNPNQNLEFSSEASVHCPSSLKTSRIFKMTSITKSIGDFRIFFLARPTMDFTCIFVLYFGCPNHWDLKAGGFGHPRTLQYRVKPVQWFLGRKLSSKIPKIKPGTKPRVSCCTTGDVERTSSLQWFEIGNEV